MRKSDAFPTRFFKAKDFPYEPQIFTVESVRVEEIKHNDKTQSKYVVYFAGVKSGLVLGPTVWEEICKATGEEDSDNWRGRSIELFRTETIFGGKTVDCIRVRPLSGQLPLKKSKPKPAAPPPAQSGGGGDMDDSIPFAAEWRT
ncbi:MAG: hypothetical protein WAK55_06520 [Xanthobacteraceae bacterium]